MIILFDLDGTLIDSTDAIVSTFHHSFDVHGATHPSDDEIKALIGYPLDIMFSELGVEESKVWDYVSTYKERYKIISCVQTELLASAEPAVKCANNFARLGIVTTKTGAYSQVLMEHFNLMQYFEVLIGREHVQNPKPHEEPILKALEIMGNIDEDVWMIGDTKLDLLSAKNAKISSIGVLSGYDTKETLQKYTKIIFSNAFEAVKYPENNHKNEIK